MMYSNTCCCIAHFHSAK